MKNTGTISGMAILDLDWNNGRLVVIQENDHILRRFGQVDVVKIAAGKSLETCRAGGADEVWTLLDGEAKLQLTDRREESPTLDRTMEILINGESAQAIMIPFGVHARISGQSDGTLLRITSHADELFPEDNVFSRG